MRNTIAHSLILLILTMLATSCATNQKYGKLSDRYSSKRSRSYNNVPYKDQTSKYAEAKPMAKSKVKSTIVSGKEEKGTESRETLVSSAKQYIGIPYKSAGKTPSEGFDCSGFANYIFHSNGYNISGPSYDLAKLGEHRSADELKPGDLVFFGIDSKINHVGIVTKRDTEDTYFIHSSTSEGIKIDRLFTNQYWKSRFLFGRDVMYHHSNQYLASKP